MIPSEPNPMEILRHISPEGARTYMEHRAAIMENPQLAALPPKVKLLVGIGVAAALQSSRCTLMWVKQARAAGVTDAEIVEAVLTARLMKAATVNARRRKRWLSDDQLDPSLAPATAHV